MNELSTLKQCGVIMFQYYKQFHQFEDVTADQMIQVYNMLACDTIWLIKCPEVISTQFREGLSLPCHH